MLSMTALKNFFLKNSPEKLTRYVSFTAMGTRCYRTMKILMHYPQYSLCNSKQDFFPFFHYPSCTNTVIEICELLVSRTQSCLCFQFPVLMSWWLTWQPAGFGTIYFTKRKNKELLVQLHKNVECLLWKDLCHCYKTLFMVSGQTGETL